MIYRGVLPFIAVNFVALLVITYVPAISMRSSARRVSADRVRSFRHTRKAGRP